MFGPPEISFRLKLTEIQSKLSDAIQAAFAAQDERIELLERLHQLELEIVDLKASNEKQLGLEAAVGRPRLGASS
jgi:hypothetical protein